MTHICIPIFNNGSIEIMLLHLNFAENMVNKLHQSCFKNMVELQVLLLGSNEITNIETGSFQQLSSLIYLDISNNKITHALPHVFEGLSSLKILNISQFVSFSSIHKAAFEGKMNEEAKIFSSDYHLCCASKRICSSKILWPQNCHNLFYKQYFTIICCSTSGMLLLTSIVAIFLDHHLRSKQAKPPKESGFVFLVSATYTYYICFTVSQTPLIGFDLYWYIDFIESAISMKGSYFCMVLGPVNLFLLLAVFSNECLVVITRYFVVEYPMTTRFKKSDFVAKIQHIMKISLAVLTGSLLLIYTYGPGFHLLSMPMCSFLAQRVASVDTVSEVLSLTCCAYFFLLAVVTLGFSAATVTSSSFSETKNAQNQDIVLKKQKNKKKVKKKVACYLLLHIPMLVIFAITLLFQASPVKQYLTLFLWVSLLVMPTCFTMNVFLLSYDNICEIMSNQQNASMTGIKVATSNIGRMCKNSDMQKCL